jgi:hypothetical protein
MFDQLQESLANKLAGVGIPGIVMPQKINEL